MMKMCIHTRLQHNIIHKQRNSDKIVTIYQNIDEKHYIYTLTEFFVVANPLGNVDPKMIYMVE